MTLHHLIKKAAVVAASVVAGGVIIAGASVAVTASAQDNNWGTPAQDQVSEGARKSPKCLDARNAGGFHVVDEKTLLVRDGFGNGYLLDIGGPCRSMNNMSQFGFELYGSTEICRAHDAKILYSHSGGIPVKCLINGVKPISREEADALLEKD